MVYECGQSLTGGVLVNPREPDECKDSPWKPVVIPVTDEGK